MKARLTMLVVALLGLAVLGAGCGGSGDSSSGSSLTTSSLSKAAFVKQANAICKSGSDRMISSMRKYAAENPSGSGTEAIQKLVPPVLVSQAEEVRALGAPSGEAPAVEAYLAALEQSVERVESEKPADLLALQETLAPVDSSAAAYGLVACEY